MLLFLILIASCTLAEIVVDRYAIADVVDRVSPAVIHILMEDVHGIVSTGSGFLISSDGLIITNHHVVNHAGDIKVVFADKTEINHVSLIGGDQRTDIAVLQLEDLPYLYGTPQIELGDSDQIRVGEWVIALGSPFASRLGPEVTVTAGIIGAKNRTIESGGRMYMDYLQTDAAINPGNSGGPLVNLDGKVIGINAAIIPFAQGIGFAIPINRAIDIVDTILTHGRVLWPWIGVELTSVNDPSGALVSAVVRQGPASKSGLRINDIIVEINRQAIATDDDVHRIIDEMEIGEQVFIVALRDGYRINLVCEIEAQP